MPCVGVCLGSVGAGVPSWTPQFLWLPKPGFLLFSSSTEKLSSPHTPRFSSAWGAHGPSTQPFPLLFPDFGCFLQPGCLALGSLMGVV